MNNKTEKQLNFTCSQCFTLYKLLEIHEQASSFCQANCQTQWQEILSKHYQDCIILHLAQEEANKEENND